MNGSGNKDFHLATKREKVISFEAKWMGLESPMVGEVSQTHKDKHGVFLEGGRRSVREEEGVSGVSKRAAGAG